MKSLNWNHSSLKIQLVMNSNINFSRQHRFIGMLLVLLGTLVFLAFTHRNSTNDKDKIFVVGKSDAKYLAKKVEARLYKAIVKGYGKKPRSVELLKEGRHSFLSWSFGASNGLVENISVKLKSVEGNSVIDFGGPLSLTNCKTTSDCSCCKTDCSCSKKNGGQEDCGSSNCDEVPVDDFLPTGMTETLLG